MHLIQGKLIHVVIQREHFIGYKERINFVLDSLTESEKGIPRIFQNIFSPPIVGSYLVHSRFS